MYVYVWLHCANLFISRLDLSREDTTSFKCREVDTVESAYIVVVSSLVAAFLTHAYLDIMP